jgi:hypothetical protein
MIRPKGNNTVADSPQRNEPVFIGKQQPGGLIEYQQIKNAMCRR